MRLNHNIAALNTYNQLSKNSSLTNKALGKLSSGLRINQAGDDPAGLSISEKMRAQIRGLNQATRNAQDGISLVQTAEGALNETSSILQRMRELAVQAGNDTATSTDRATIQSEMDQLANEITRIADTTKFNGKELMSTSTAFSGVLQIGSDSGQTLSISMTSMDAITLGVAEQDYNASSSVDTGNVTVDTTSYAPTEAGDVTVDVTGITLATNATATLTISGAVVDGQTFTIGDDTYEIEDSTVGDGITAGNIAVSIATGDLGDTTVAADAITLAINTSGTGAYSVDANSDATVVITADDVGVAGNSIAATAGTLANGSWDTGGTLEGGAEASATVVSSDSATNTILGDDITLSNGVVISLTDTVDSSVTLTATAVDGSLAGLTISDNTTASTALTAIDTAIDTVSTQRSTLGSYQNRLEHTIKNLGTAAENMTAAESRIRDVDMASEMMEFTKMNILSQAAQSMLAQANAQPQNVLQLLR